MRVVNMHEAKTNLSRIVEAAAQGEPFVIARAGRPLVKVSVIEDPAAPVLRRTGFLAGHIRTPEDFDRMETEAVAALFDAAP